MTLKNQAASLLMRLAKQEYLPFTGWLLTWTLAVPAVGHADAARILAATMLGRTCWAFAVVETQAVLHARRGTDEPNRRRSFREALKIEAASLAAEAAMLALVVAGLLSVNQAEAAWFTALLAIGAPARHLLILGGTGMRVDLFRLCLTWSGALLVAIALFGKMGAAAVALAMGLREWLAVAIVLSPLGRKPGPLNAPTSDSPLTWREVASRTAIRSRDRLTYRVSKGLLGALLGPFGGIVARTSRGVGIFRRAGHLVPNGPRFIAILGGATSAVAIALQVALPNPATLVISASLLRIAASAASALMWRRYIDPASLDDEDADIDC